MRRTPKSTLTKSSSVSPQPRLVAGSVKRSSRMAVLADAPAADHGSRRCTRLLPRLAVPEVLLSVALVRPFMLAPPPTIVAAPLSLPCSRLLTGADGERTCSLPIKPFVGDIEEEAAEVVQIRTGRIELYDGRT